MRVPGANDLDHVYRVSLKGRFRYEALERCGTENTLQGESKGSIMIRNDLISYKAIGMSLVIWLISENKSRENGFKCELDRELCKAYDE